jgi:hypothetical protein
MGPRSVSSLLILVTLFLPALASATTTTDFVFSRAMYGPWSVAEMGNFSFEAKYRNSWWLHTGAERVMANFASESLDAAANNVTYIAGLYYHMAPWDRLTFNYSHAVKAGAGKEPKTPSPVDETWWKHLIDEPAVAIANLSLHYPIWGLVWDIELYGHENFLRKDYSYDQAAIDEFANDTGRTIPAMSPSERYFWFRDNGLVGDFQDWQEQKAFSMARATEQKVHAINPNLSLGILGVEDSWFHWAILRGFNSSTAPVTSWCELTYGRYRTEGIEGVQHFLDLWEEYGLNGKFIPGLRAHHIFEKLFWNLEAAIRHNGAFWIYQHNGDPFAYTTEEEYVRMYQVFDEYFYFGTGDADPLPAFELLPGVGAKPYLAPDGTSSVFLHTYEDDIPVGFTIATESRELVYIGENLSTVTLEGPNPVLRPGDLPCILSRLDPDDLIATEALALIRELEELLHLFGVTELGTPPSATEALDLAYQDFETGSYGAVRSTLLEVRDQVYASGLDGIWPQVEAGFASPRDSEVPLSILRTFSLARSAFDRGEPRQGELQLIQGLNDLSLKVNEPGLPALLALVSLPAIATVTRRRARATK